MGNSQLVDVALQRDLRVPLDTKLLQPRSNPPLSTRHHRGVNYSWDHHDSNHGWEKRRDAHSNRRDDTRAADQNHHHGTEQQAA